VLARYEQIIDEPRTLLTRAGLTVREPANTKAMTWCCGGPVEALYPAKARASAERRVAQLRQVAGTGVTMCPLCLVSLRKGANGTLPVQDISHYLRRAYPDHQRLVSRQAADLLSTVPDDRPAS